MIDFLFALLRDISLLLPVLLSGIMLIHVLKTDKLSRLNVPLDFNKIVKKKPIFGKNKTFRGLLIYIGVSSGVCTILFFGYHTVYYRLIHPVYEHNPLFLGCIFGCLYTLGELTNSFVKRRIGIKVGNTLLGRFGTLQKVIDLSDGILFIAVFFFFFDFISLQDAFIASGLGILIHICTDIYMRDLHLKK